MAAFSGRYGLVACSHMKITASSAVLQRSLHVMGIPMFVRFTLLVPAVWSLVFQEHESRFGWDASDVDTRVHIWPWHPNTIRIAWIGLEMPGCFALLKSVSMEEILTRHAICSASQKTESACINSSSDGQYTCNKT